MGEHISIENHAQITDPRYSLVTSLNQVGYLVKVRNPVAISKVEAAATLSKATDSSHSEERKIIT